MASRLTFTADPATQPKLYASPETKLLLGPLAAQMPSWAGMDVMLVSKQDLQRYIDKPTLDKMYAGATSFDIGRLSRSFNHFAADLGYDYSPPKMYHGHEMGTIIDVRNTVALLAAVHAPATVSLNSRDYLASQGNLCVIGVEEPASADQTISRFTDMNPGDTAFNLNHRDLNILYYAHETGHCAQYEGYPTTYDTPRREIEADQHMMNIVPSQYIGALGQNKQKEIFDLRVIEAFNRMDSDHSTTAALNVAGREPDYEPYEKDFLRRVGEDRFIEKLFRDKPEEAARVFVNAIGFNDIMHKATNLIQDQLSTDADDARYLLKSDHRLMYETVKKLKNDGSFDSSPLEMKYADQYLAAMNAHSYEFVHQSYALPDADPGVPKFPRNDTPAPSSNPLPYKGPAF